MDKIILNEDQLDYLKNYIRKRGIREPDVVHEILDHFACKAEELMAARPAMPWEQVVRQAHQAFGPTGFRPLIATYEAGLEQELKQSYWRELKKTLQSPAILFLIAVAVIGAATYRRWSAAIPSGSFFPATDYLIFITLGIWGALRVAIVYRNPYFKRNRGLATPLWQKKATLVPDAAIVSVLFSSWIVQGRPETLVSGWIYAFLCTCILLFLLVQWKVMRHVARRCSPAATA